MRGDWSHTDTMTKFQKKQINPNMTVLHHAAKAQETSRQAQLIKSEASDKPSQTMSSGRKANLPLRMRILTLRKAGYSISMTAKLAGCSVSHVKNVTALSRSV
jgi:hypothetical protein